jgi:hypothetical protein
MTIIGDEAAPQFNRIVCKHDTRWQVISRLKANTLYSLRKTVGVSKTQQLRLEIGTAI